MPLDLNIFGEGIYTPREAARLIGSTPQDILRWTRGSGPNEPLWHAYYQALDDITEINFFDLIELRVVRAFRRAGVSLQSVRYAIKVAQEKFGVDHPLSTLDFKTDGREMFMDAVEKDGEYVSLAKKRPGQKVFAEIVRQSLRDLEYDGNTVSRWRPSFAKSIVIDPNRAFGAPILDEFGVSTEILYNEYSLFGDTKYLSANYEIPIKLINDAISYERHLDQMATNIDGKGTI